MSIPVTIFLAAATASVPPVVILPPPPPSPARYASSRGPDDEQSAITTIAVEVTAGATVLWDGSLRLRRSMQANYNQSSNEAGPACAVDPDLAYRSGQSRRDLRIAINSRGEGDQFSVSANWTRPAQNCVEAGTRTVSFDQQITLRPGERIRLTGDGGLVVKLTRAK